MADVDAGFVENCAEISGTTPDEGAVTDDDCDTQVIDQNPDILVALVCPGLVHMLLGMGSLTFRERETLTDRIRWICLPTMRRLDVRAWVPFVHAGLTCLALCSYRCWLLAAGCVLRAAGLFCSITSLYFVSHQHTLPTSRPGVLPALLCTHGSATRSA